MTIKELKNILAISDKDIAKMLGLKNLVSYQNSSAKKRYESTLIQFLELVIKMLSENEEDRKREAN